MSQALTNETLKAAREAKGLTLRAAAELVGISHMTLCYAERGIVARPETVVKILKAYGFEGLEKNAGICTSCHGTGRPPAPEKTPKSKSGKRGSKK